MKEGNLLFNNTLSTFYLRLYGVGNMANDQSVREETLCCHYIGYFFQISMNGSFICTNPQTGSSRY